MKWINFFIDRPVTATIINLMLVVCGILAFQGLLLDEYPRIIVPKVRISTPYRNASAETVEKEITNPIEEAMSLVEGVESISSTSRSGFSEVKLRFLSNVSMDRAVMQVSEQLARIMPELPDGADSPQIKRGAGHNDGFIYLGITSTSLSGSALTHFAKTHVKNYFQGIDGVAEVEVMGAPYAVSILLNSLAMYTERISPDQIIKVLKENELLLQAGRMRTEEPINLDMVAKDVKDYGDLIVAKNGPVAVRLSDISDINLIDDDSLQKIRIDGQNAVVIRISKSPDGNNLRVADAIYAMVSKVNQEIKGQAEVTIQSDHSIFVRASLKTIFHTILEACVLVILIIFLFLRHIRATLIPLVTIPISLIATFFALKLFNLSINTISLLAMVLAVGLVVDDAIVVLENIFRYKEKGFSAMEAARKGASEVGFAIIAMTITLVSVFLPLAFVNDITGVILREFAITLACSVLFSGIVALTLSPLMCAHFLKHEPKENFFGKSIERAIKSLESGYNFCFAKVFLWRRFVFLGMVPMLVIGIFLYKNLQSRLLPNEDRGIIGASIVPVAGFDLEALEPYAARVEQIFLKREDIERTLIFSFGKSITVISVLKPWAKRPIHAEKIVEAIREEIAAIPTVNVFPWSWNKGLSALDDDGENADIALALKTVGSYEDLDAIAQKLSDRIRKDDVLLDPRSDLSIDEKAYSVTLLREPIALLGIDEKAISIALQTFSNRIRASEFKMAGQRYEVYLEADMPTEDLNAIYIATKDGLQIPLSTIATIKKTVQAPELTHLNQMRAAHIFANLKSGQSLSEAKNYLDKVIKETVPKNISVSFEGALAMQKKTGQTFLLLFVAGLIFIFAVMAIQFEGILDPLIILLTVPFAGLGGIIILWISNSDINLYTQVGLLTLIGLITKHGILLTEFVSMQKRLGMPLKDAVFLAANLRFRPIVMTTAATVLGALPLVVSQGAGMEARASIGLVIVGGMIFGTLLTLFVLPSSIYEMHLLKARFSKRLGVK